MICTSMSIYRVYLYTTVVFLLEFISRSTCLDQALQGSAWINNPSLETEEFADGSQLRLILKAGLNYSVGRIGCGFYRTNISNDYTLSIVVYSIRGGYSVPVWSANRNHLVENNATLQLAYDGNLILQDRNGSSVWSTARATGGTKILKLLDTGNLVIMNDDIGSTVWQSFDHPVDCLLPGQYLKQGMSLVSSKSSHNLGEGYFSLVSHPAGLAFYVRITDLEPEPYYVINVIDGNKLLTSVLSLNCGSAIASYNSSGSFKVHLLSHKCSQNGSFEFLATVQPSEITFARLDTDGGIRIYGVDANHLQVHNARIAGTGLRCFSLPCGGCNLVGTCGLNSVCSDRGTLSCTCPAPEPFALSMAVSTAKNPILQCSMKRFSSCADAKYKSLHLRGVDYFSTAFITPLRISPTDCFDMCSRNCSCLAAFSHGKNCYFTHQLHSFRNVVNTDYLGFFKIWDDGYASSVISPNISEGINPAAHGKKLKVHASVLGGLIAAFFVILFVLFAFHIYRFRRLSMHKKASEIGSIREMVPCLPYHFSFKELQIATHDFSEKLGKGAFGSVYKGTLPDGTLIAVKQLETTHQGGQEQFQAEVRTIGSLHHLNLVQLIGFCAEGLHRLLVYEYMVNSSLDAWLFASNLKKTKWLNWETRFRIALAVARGISYLHEECRHRIIHCDIKPQNILLDDKFVAKISDFGLSELVCRDQKQVVITMRGTPGYLAPEWLLQTSINEKSDIYSYGMMTLELVSGRKNVDISLGQETWYFPSWAFNKFKEGNGLFDVIEERLTASPDFDIQQAETVLKVAFWCIQDDPLHRPCMSTALQMLEGLLEVPDPPVPSAQYMTGSLTIVSVDERGRMSLNSFKQMVASSLCSR